VAVVERGTASSTQEEAHPCGMRSRPGRAARMTRARAELRTAAPASERRVRRVARFCGGVCCPRYLLTYLLTYLNGTLTVRRERTWPKRTVSGRTCHDAQLAGGTLSQVDLHHTPALLGGWPRWTHHQEYRCGPAAAATHSLPISNAYARRIRATRPPALVPAQPRARAVCVPPWSPRPPSAPIVRTRRAVALRRSHR